MVGSRYDAPHCDYSDKGKAIRALTGDNRFTKDIDYKVFTQNGKNPTEGRSTIVYTITAFCAYKQAHSKFFFASLNNRSTRFSNSPSGISIMSFICTCILSFAKE